MKHEKTKHISLEEFKKSPAPRGTENILAHFNGGNFMQCHREFFAATGVWIEELVPVFQKLDATLALRELPAQLR